MPTRNVAILLFEDVEVLDFCGPLEVFSVTGQEQSPPPFHVYTVAETAKPIHTINGLSVNPTFEISNCPPPNILIVPGGKGARKQIHNTDLLDWISEQAKQVELLISVCTGALLLGKAGLLDGLSATTHHSAITLLKGIAPTATVHENKRIVDTDKSSYRPASAPESICRCTLFVDCSDRNSRPKRQRIWNTIGTTIRSSNKR